MLTIKECLDFVTTRFKDVGIASPNVDASALLQFVTGYSRNELILERNQILEPKLLEQLELLVQRREHREPLQWILEYATFYGLNLRVRAGVLVPRPETERLVQIVIQILTLRPKKINLENNYLRIVDIGTGTGAIALSIKYEIPSANVFATDISLDAVKLALENASSLNLKIVIQQADLLNDLTNFDVIVSNPPYLPESDLETLEPEVQHDPHTALFSDHDGLGVARRILQIALSTLKPGGLLALELDPRNVRALANEFNNIVWKDVLIHSDLTGRERFVTAILRPDATLEP